MQNTSDAGERFPSMAAVSAPNQNTSAYFALGICISLWLGFLVVAPGLLRYVFVATSFSCALYLFMRHETHYVSFTWWLYFLTPFLRRVVDYRAGFDPGGFMLAAPLFASAICCFELTKLRLNDSRSAPFVLLSLGASYGFAVSVLKGTPPAIALQYFLAWLGPVAFGYYIYLRWSKYLGFRDTLQKTFTYGLIVMGAYAVVQYFYAPAWDAFWMNNVAELIDSFGRPEPMEIRVFSTMNAPQVFGLATALGVLITLQGRNSIVRRVAWVAGYAGLLLSMARSAWLEWGVALVALAVLTRSRKAISTILLTIVIMGTLSVLIMRSSFGDSLSRRFETLNDLKNDASGQDRLIAYEQVFSNSISSPFGEGWRMESVDHGIISLHDSTIFEVLICTGWFGLLAFYGAIVVSLLLIIKSGLNSVSPDSFLPLLAAILIALLAETFWNTMMGGPNEMGLMTCIGIAFAGMNFRDQQTAMQPA